MWELDHKGSWMLKNWCFELWYWRRLLRVPWTARRSNQSILREINSEYPLEGLMLELKLQYCGHLMGRANSLEKTLMLGKIESKRRRGWQRMRWLDHIIDWMDTNLSKLQVIAKDRAACCASVHEVTESQTWLIHKTTSSTLKKRSASFTGWAIWSPSLSVFFPVLSLTKVLCPECPLVLGKAG